MEALLWLRFCHGRPCDSWRKGTCSSPEESRKRLRWWKVGVGGWSTWRCRVFGALLLRQLLSILSPFHAICGLCLQPCWFAEEVQGAFGRWWQNQREFWGLPRQIPSLSVSELWGDAEFKGRFAWQVEDSNNSSCGLARQGCQACSGKHPHADRK